MLPSDTRRHNYLWTENFSSSNYGGQRIPTPHSIGQTSFHSVTRQLREQTQKKGHTRSQQWDRLDSVTSNFLQTP